MRILKLMLSTFALAGFAGAPVALASGSPSGGAGLGIPAFVSTASHPMVSGTRAKIIHGVAYAPFDAPKQVQEAIWAGNKIRLKPYLWGGGHGSWNSPGYDCSGATSYVLHAAGLLSSPDDSTDFESWGHAGTGRWMTVYTNPVHAFIQIAGVRFDTSAEADPGAPSGSGPRWRPVFRPSGFEARHPRGL